MDELNINGSENKKSIMQELKARLPLIVGVLAMILVGVAIYGVIYKGIIRTKVTPTPTLVDKNVIETFAPDKSLPGFPSSIPTPAGATVTRNIKLTTPEGRVQLTKQLTSPKSLKEIFDFYVSSLTSSSAWKIVNKFDDPKSPNIKAVLAQGNEGSLTVSIRYNTITKLTDIDLSLTKAK